MTRDVGHGIPLDCVTESPLQTAQPSLSRRLADSNCCYLPERDLRVNASLLFSVHTAICAAGLKNPYPGSPAPERAGTQREAGA